MAGMGPPPKPQEQRRRRNATGAGAVVRLPAAGRKGDPPPWPLPPELRTAVAIETAERRREILEAQLSAGEAPKSAPATLAKLDQQLAELRARQEAAVALEVDLWVELWATPQAVAWERFRFTREVAQYVRWKVLGELGDLDAAKEARQLADRLGLTPLALLRCRWEIVDEAPAATAPGLAPVVTPERWQRQKGA